MNDMNHARKIVHARLKHDRILIVDDEKDVREYMQRSLGYFGFNNFRVAPIAEKALEIVRENDIALALIDLRMPGKDGLWLLKKIRKLQVDTATIVVSASHEFDDVKEALNQGAECYLSKPVCKEELNHTVTNVLEKRHLMLANLEFRKKLESIVWDNKDL